jgi:UDP-glucose 4-epimerase
MVTIALTGADGFWGGRMIRELAAREQVERIQVFELNPPRSDSPKVTTVKMSVKPPFHNDWMKPLEKDIPDCLMILYPEIPSPAGDRTRIQTVLKLLWKAIELGVPRIIVLSSAYVYGSRFDNPAFLSEDALTRGDRSDHFLDDLLTLEEVSRTAIAAKSIMSSVVIFRPVTVLGAHVDNQLTRYLHLPVIPVYLGFDPVLQLIHEDDLVMALLRATESTFRGVFNLAGDGFVTLSELCNLVSKRTIPVFHTFMDVIGAGLFYGGVSQFSPSFLAKLRYRLVVDTSRSAEILQFKTRYSCRAAINDFRKRRNR